MGPSYLLGSPIRLPTASGRRSESHVHTFFSRLGRPMAHPWLAEVGHDLLAAPKKALVQVHGRSADHRSGGLLGGSSRMAARAGRPRFDRSSSLTRVSWGSAPRRPTSDGDRPRRAPSSWTVPPRSGVRTSPLRRVSSTPHSTLSAAASSPMWRSIIAPTGSSRSGLRAAGRRCRGRCRARPRTPRTPSRCWRRGSSPNPPTSPAQRSLMMSP